MMGPWYKVMMLLCVHSGESASVVSQVARPTVCLNLRDRTPETLPCLLTIQKCVIGQIMMGNSSPRVRRAGTVGGPKGSSKNMTVGKQGKEKLDSIKRGKIPNGEFRSIWLQDNLSREHGGT